jgi:hypothetical protein
MSLKRFKERFFLLFEQAEQDALDFRLFMLAQQCGVSEPHAQERLLQWSWERLIQLSAYDGSQYRLCDEWADANEFFLCPTSGGYFRVSLLANGRDFVEDLQKRPIGFPTS